MATAEEFKFHAVADSVEVTCGAETVKVRRPKLYCVYEGLSLTFVLRFGKGTEDTTQHISVVFGRAVDTLESLGITTIFPHAKPVQYVNWRCNVRPPVTNYSSSKADPEKPEHKLVEILRLPGARRIEMLVPLHKSFHQDEWVRVRETWARVSDDLEAMLALYPNPSQPPKALPPIAECRPRPALDSFVKREMWGATMMAAVNRERAVHLQRLQKLNMEDCWGIFEKVDNGIICNVYAQPAGRDIPHIVNPAVGDKLKLDLRYDGHHELSALATSHGTTAIITDVSPHSDFVIRLLGTAVWTEKDLNFGRVSTIKLERANIYVSSRRHLEAVQNCYNTPRTPGSFPLDSMLVLNQPLPSINRTEPSKPVFSGLMHIYSLLNKSQQDAFRICHTTGSPGVLIQGPPGTGKTVTLAKTAIGFSIRGEKVVIATPSNNASNQICETIAGFWAPGTDPAKRPAVRPPRVIRWLTPATDQSIMNNARAWGIPESMAEMSMARRIQERVRSAIREGTDWEKPIAEEWLDLWKRRRVLKETESRRFKDLTFAWEKRCLNEAEIIITTCDNAYTLDAEAFGAKVVILDECSQGTEAAVLLPVERFIKTLKLVILGGDDQQLQPFVISTAAENEFHAQLRKSWFERVRLSTFVPCITLGQQYRMRPEISNIIIRHFYKDKLVDDPSTSVARPTYNKYMSLADLLNRTRPEWAASDWPKSNVLMIDMPEGARAFSITDPSGSRYNSGHILIVRDLCLTLLAPSSGIHSHQVVVITPYAAQRVRHIRALDTAASLNPELRKVVVSTVDKYQGQESDIVILDLVIRSRRSTTLGFMKERNRLNVAISRARDVLIVVGDAHLYKRLISKRKVLKEAQLFLNIMCDIAKNTVLWKGDTSDLKEIDAWDRIEGEIDEEDEADTKEGDDIKEGHAQSSDASRKFRY